MRPFGKNTWRPNGRRALHLEAIDKIGKIGKTFDSALDGEVIRRFEFESFGHAEAIVNRFVEFYNSVRSLFAIGCRTPREVYQ